MARAKLHPLLEALQGAVGDVVFKRYGDRVVVSRKPDMSRRTLSAKQRAHHERVRRAAAWGRTARDTPELAALYAPAAEAAGQAVYHVAFRDAMHAPEIEEIDVSAFTPGAGGTIEIVASDDFEIVRVQVEVMRESGQVIALVDAERTGATWSCTLDPDTSEERNASLRVRAFDGPGNVTEQNVRLDGD